MGEKLPIQFTVKVPITCEFRSRYESPGFSQQHILHIQKKFKFYENIINISSKDNKITLEIENVLAQDEPEAIDSSIEIVNSICKAISLEYQQHNHNQHHGQVRVTWDKWKTEAFPRKTIYIKLKTQIVCEFKTKFIEVYLSKILENKEISLLTSLYYNALAPTDLGAQFFNAFSIIEYLEKKYNNNCEQSQCIDFNSIEQCILNNKDIDKKNIQKYIKIYS